MKQKEKVDSEKVNFSATTSVYHLCWKKKRTSESVVLNAFCFFLLKTVMGKKIY